MKKLLSVLISIGLLNIILFGSVQGNTEIQDGYAILANMKLKVLEAEQMVAEQKVTLLQNEEILNELKKESQSLDSNSIKILHNIELLVNGMRLQVLESENALNDMRSNVIKIEIILLKTGELLQANNLLNNSLVNLDEINVYNTNDTEIL